MSERILVAVDVNEADIAQPAIEAALEIARAGGGDIRLVHVRSPIPVTRMDFIPPDFFAEQETYSKGRLAELAAKLPLDTARISTASRFGTIYVEILEEAKEWGASLVVVSAHQPSMATYLLGSNATKVVRHAHCSVLVARSDKKASLFD